MSWLAVCTSFGEEYSVIQGRMRGRQDQTGQAIRSCRGFYSDVPIELVLMGTGFAGVEKLEGLKWTDWQGVLHLGYCGGLSDKLHVGDLVWPERLRHESGDVLETEDLHLVMATTAPIHRGDMLTVDRLIPTQTEKAQLHQKFGSLSVDMESFHLTRLSLERGLSAIVLKAVADGLEDDLPPFGSDLDRQAIQAGTGMSPDLARRWRDNMKRAAVGLSEGASQMIPLLHKIWSF